MAKMYPGNLNSRAPDHGTISDHVDDQARNHGFEKKARGVVFSRGGGRGGGRSDHVRCCYRCGDPGHLIRDCPTSALPVRGYVRRGNQASGNDLFKDDLQDFFSGTTKSGIKLSNTPTGISTNSDPAKPFFDDSLHSKVDISLLLSKIEHKEKELDLRDKEIQGLNIQLKKATSELSSAQVKNEEMLAKMNSLQDDCESIYDDLLTVRIKEVNMSLECESLKELLKNTENQMMKKIDMLEETNLTVQADMMKVKLEMEQWRKTAKAIASVSFGDAEMSSKTPELESLVAYYSNRATKRLSLGKLRKALDDCRMSARLDPGFLKVCLTAGNCHLVLGEIDDALYNYKKCLESGVICLDRRFIIEASAGLQNVEKVVNYTKESAEYLQQKTCESANNALEVITEALSISCHSEKLLEMKAEALFMLQKYEEVIQMCEQTLDFAEKNSATTGDSNHVSDEERKRPLKLWRWRLMSRSYFCTSRFDKALVILEEYEQLAPAETKTKEAFSPSATTVRELLRCKNAGNEAYQSGRHREAVEHYSKAVLVSIESRPFTAICLCNRAAAHQALGEVIDAIADCNLAIALDANYLKAISRRANLHAKIRDYEHAALDLQKLISLLEKRSEGNYAQDLSLARTRLSAVNKNMKKGMTLHFDLILGLKGSECASEIKKAYRKAALRHHPDKAGKFLARCDGGADGHIWKGIFTTIHEDADKLFKIIGEAYAVLSDPDKRFKYNLEEAMKDDFPW